MGVLLTHYTRSIQAVCGILQNGFAWVPNRRGLISSLVPSHSFGSREPQQFGMISFTELEPSEGSFHRDNFGDFGISVSDLWAQRNNAQKVIYVDQEGPVFEALRRLFQCGYQQVTSAITYPDDGGLRMAYTNKFMARAVGAPVWESLLQLYEYLEPIEHSGQQEWRIVDPRPVYGLPESVPEVIAAVSPPRGWAQFTHVVRMKPADVLRFVCPACHQEELRASIPEEYRNAPICWVEQ